jgi:hypothetical protein
MLVRFYLARCANQEREAWPSLNTIAKRCKISKPTAIKALRELEDQGWIRKTVRQRANREYDTTVYSIEDPPVPAGSSKPDLPPVKVEGGGKGDLPPRGTRRNAGGTVGGSKAGLLGGKDGCRGGKDGNGQTNAAVGARGGNNTQITIPDIVVEQQQQQQRPAAAGSPKEADGAGEKGEGREEFFPRPSPLPADMPSPREINADAGRDFEWTPPTVQEAVQSVAGVPVSLSVACRIVKHFGPADLARALAEMKRQLASGLTFKKGVGSWLQAAMKEGWDKDTIPPAPARTGQGTRSNGRSTTSLNPHDYLDSESAGELEALRAEEGRRILQKELEDRRNAEKRRKSFCSLYA